MKRAPKYNLPRMPDIPITLTIPVVFRLQADFTRFSNGSLMMQIGWTKYQNKRKQEIGSVGTSPSAQIAVSIKDRIWSVNPIDLFNAVKEAEKEYLKERRKGDRP